MNVRGSGTVSCAIEVGGRPDMFLKVEGIGRRGMNGALRGMPPPRRIPELWDAVRGVRRGGGFCLHPAPGWVDQACGDEACPRVLVPLMPSEWRFGMRVRWA